MIFKAFIISLLWIFIMTVQICFAQTPSFNCKSAKTGRFVINDPSIGHKSEIIRKKKIQIEKNLHTGETATFSIKWLSDCEYQLKLIDGPKLLLAFYREKVLQVKMTGRKDKIYYYSAKFLNDKEDRELDFQMEKVE